MPSSSPGSFAAIRCCWIEPPEQPLPIVYLIEPNDSRICSWSIITDSPETQSLAFCPRMFSDEFATRKPRDKAMSTSADDGPACVRHGAVPPPKSQYTLWFQPACGDHGVHGFAGSTRTASS